MGSAPRWSEEEKALLRDNTWMSNEEISEKIGRSAFCVMKMRTKLKLPGAQRPDRRKWTDEELNFVHDHPELSLKQIATALDRTYSSVNNIRFKERIAAGIIPDKRKTGRPVNDLLLRPPGTYVEIVGLLLLDFTEAWECWMHAHGYTSYEVKFTDSLGWVTMTCVKEH
jgi:hypothetical protein